MILKPKAVIGRVQSKDTIRLWQRFSTSSTIVTLFHLTDQVVAVFLVTLAVLFALLSGHRATTNCNIFIAIGHKPVAFFCEKQNFLMDDGLIEISYLYNIKQYEYDHSHTIGSA